MEDAMTAKDVFSADEWKRVATAPFLVSMAIGVADPSGPFGMVKEGAALAKAVQAGAAGTAGELAKAVAAELREHKPSARDLVGEGANNAASASGHAVDGLKAVADLVDAKSGADGAPFKAWLSTMAQAVAEAAKEGGVLGFGGKAISEGEQQALDAIKVALGA
jgi:hypothetical protein